MNFYIFRKYWGKHKGRMFSLVLSIILLTATVVFSILNERAELRAELHEMYYSRGNYSVVLHNVSSEASEKIYESFDDNEVGVISAVGKTKINEVGYTVGCFEESKAVSEYYLPFIKGGLPDKGEIAVPQFLLEQMYSDIDIGDTVEFNMTDLSGGNVHMSYTLSGIIDDNIDRMDTEYTHNYFGIALNEQLKSPTPSIFISKEDSSVFEKYYNYLICPDERELFYDTSNQIDEKLKDIYPLVEGVSTGSEYLTLIEMSNNNGNKHEDLTVKQTDNIRVIHIITTFMMIVAAIAMFSGVAAIMPKRIEALRLLRTVGMSKRKLLNMFITEFILFWIIGNVLGMALGCGVHELVCGIRNHLGISAYRGYIVEYIVGEMTESPFIKPLLISLAVAAASIILPVIKILRMQFDKNDTVRKSRHKAKTFSGAFSKITNNGILAYLSSFSVIIVIIVSSLGYCYYTNLGKGKSFLSYNLPDAAENIYKVNNIDMKKNELDCAVQANIPSGNLVSVLDKEYGVTPDKAAKLNKKAAIYAWSEYPAFTVIYDRNEKSINMLDEHPLITEDWEYYDKYRVYDVGLVLLSEDMLKLLGDFSADDVVMLSKTHRSPFEIGDSIQMLSTVCDNDRVTNIESAKKINATVTKTFSTGELFESDIDMLKNCLVLNSGGEFSVAMTAEKAAELGIYHAEYSNVFLDFSDGSSDEEMRQTVKEVMGRPVNITTISELRHKAKIATLSSNAHAIILSILLIILCVVSVINLIGMSIQNNLESFSVMHMIGLPTKKIKRQFLLKGLKSTLASAIIGSAAALLGQQFLEHKYNEYLTTLEKQQILNGNNQYPHFIMFIKKSGIDPNNTELIEITKKVDTLHDTYFLDREMWEPNLLIPLLIICGFIIAVTGISTLIMLRKLNIKEGCINDKDQ